MKLLKLRPFIVLFTLMISLFLTACMNTNSTKRTVTKVSTTNPLAYEQLNDWLPDDSILEESEEAIVSTPITMESIPVEPLLLGNQPRRIPQKTSAQRSLDAINQEGALPPVHSQKEISPKFELSKSGTVELNYNKETLQQVIEELADVMNINIVIDPTIKTLKNLITLQSTPGNPLQGKDLWPTLKTLLANNEATIIHRGNFFYIKPNTVPGLPDRIGYDVLDSNYPMVMQVMPLKHIAVDTALSVLTTILQNRGIINTFPNLNILAITAPPNLIKRANALLQLLDANPFKHRGIHIYPLKNVSAEIVAVELQKILNLIEGGNSTYQLIALERINGLLVVSPPKRGFKVVDHWINILDASEAQLDKQVFIYQVKNLKATELAGTLNSLFQDKGTKKASARKTATANASSLAFSQPKTVNPISKDKTTPPKKGEKAATPSTQPAKVQTLILNDTSTSPSSSISANLDFTIVADAATNSLLVKATGRDYQQLLATIGLLDQPPLEVMVNAVIAQARLTDETSAGFNWKRILGSAENGDTDFVGTLGGISNAGPGFILSNTIGNLTFTLNALRQHSKVKVLSRPSLLVKNNQEASMKIGQKFPILTASSTNTNSLTNNNSALVTQSVSYRDTGIELTIKPQINPDGIINMEISQRISRAENTSTSNTTGAPQFSNQEVKTHVVLKDGNVIVLGGLIESDQTDNKDSVPGLGDIPILGALFSNNKVEGTRSELLLLLQANVINPANNNGVIGHEIRNRLTSASRIIDEDGFSAIGWQKFLSFPY